MQDQSLRITTHNAGKAGSTDNWNLPMKKYLRKWNKSDVIFPQETSDKTSKFICTRLHSSLEGSRARFNRIFLEQSKTSIIFRVDLFEPDYNSSFHGIINDDEVRRTGLEFRIWTFVGTVKPVALHLYELGEKLFFINVHFPTKKVENHTDLLRAVGYFAAGLVYTDSTSNSARSEWIHEKNAWITEGRSLRVFICGDFNNRNQDLLNASPSTFKKEFQLLSPLRSRTSGNKTYGCAIDGVFVHPQFAGFKYNINAHVATPPFPRDHKVVHTKVCRPDAHPIIMLDVLFAAVDDGMDDSLCFGNLYIN